MRRDAFTLIELLIVVGILVGIVGVAMLSLTDFRRESELRAVADRIEAIGALARAEALRHGEPVELILQEPPALRTGAVGSMRVLTKRLNPVQAASEEASRGQDQPAVRARTELPKWLSVAPDGDDRPAARALSERAVHRLAVFMPDGSALGARGITLRDERSGARLSFKVESLTGESSASIDWNPELSEEIDADGVRTPGEGTS